MKHIGAAVESAQRNIAEIRQHHVEHKERLIAEGVEKFGWSPDADCANCGDTGKFPNSIHFCGCPAGVARGIREREERDRAEWERRWSLTDVPRRFRSYRLEGAPDRGAAADVAAWVASSAWSDGTTLLLTGPVGTGKTALAVGALWEIHMTGAAPLAFESVPALLDQLRPEGQGEEPGLMRHCQRAVALVLDDLGAEKSSPWVVERLYVLLNARYEAQLPTIVTTNLDLMGLKDALGERTVSRLAESVAVVSVDGPDRRRG